MPRILSQTAEYALRAVVLLAEAAGRPLPAAELADIAGIPPQYLAKILRLLSRLDIVRAQRGPRGGFVLARPAMALTVLAVANAVDPPRRIVKCPLGRPGHVTLCPLHRKLNEANSCFEETLEATTIADLLPTDRPSLCPRPAPGSG